MKDINKDINHLTHAYWHHLPSLRVDPEILEQGVTEKLQYVGEDNTDQLTQWRGVVVLRATSKKREVFRPGFYDEQNISFLEKTLCTDIEFGMRQGSKSVHFFLLPENRDAEISFDIVEYTQIDDPRYANLILL